MTAAPTWVVRPKTSTPSLIPLFFSRISKSCSLCVESLARTRSHHITSTATFLAEATIFSPLDYCELSPLLLPLPTPSAQGSQGPPGKTLVRSGHCCALLVLASGLTGGEAPVPTRVIRLHTSCPHPTSPSALLPLSYSARSGLLGFPPAQCLCFCLRTCPLALLSTWSLSPHYLLPCLLQAWTQMSSSQIAPLHSLPPFCAFPFSPWHLTPSNYILLIYLVYCLFPSLEYKLQEGRDFCLFYLLFCAWHLEQGLAHSGC